MKLKNIIFSKAVGFQDITKEIELIHQLGFFVEVKSVDDWKGMLNRSYELRAVMWEEVEGDGRMKVTVCSKPNCMAREATKIHLTDKGIEFDVVDVMADEQALQHILETYRRIGGRHLQQVKEYLAQARYLDADINSRQQELDMTRKNLTSLQGQELKQDVVQSSRAGHYDDKFSLLFEISETINNKIDELVELKQDISRRIDKLDDRVYVIILRERYINMLEFHQIANRLNQSERHITRMHGQALVDFYECNRDLFKVCP